MNTVLPFNFMRQKIAVLQSELMQLPQYEPETKHYFHAGMYCREVFRPKGVLVIGKVHKLEHFYVIASGIVEITDGTGETQILTGPAVVKSKPGTKRAVMALTPVTAMTFHVLPEMSLEDAEAMLVEDEPTAYLPGNKLKTIGVFQ